MEVLDSSIYNYKIEISEELEKKAAEVFGYNMYSKANWSLWRRFLVGGVEGMEWMRHNIYMSNISETLLSSSFRFKNIACIKWALDNNYVTDSDILSEIFMDAFRYVDLHIAKFLVENNYISSDSKSHYIFFAAENGNLEVVKYLRSKDFDWNIDSSLYQSTYDNGFYECFKYVYECGFGLEFNPKIYIYHNEKERLDMTRHWVPVKKVYTSLILGNDVNKIESDNTEGKKKDLPKKTLVKHKKKAKN